MPPDDPTALAREAIQLMSDQQTRRQYIETAFQRYTELFQARTMVERTL